MFGIGETENQWRIQDFRKGAGIKRHRREDGVWEGGISLPTGVGSGEGQGLCFLPRKFLDFLS